MPFSVHCTLNGYESFFLGSGKNHLLEETRGLSFEAIVHAIEQGGLLDILAHPNTKKFGHQLLLVVKISEYVWVVPVVEDKHGLFLKTAFRSRKMTKKYLGGK